MTRTRIFQSLPHRRVPADGEESRRLGWQNSLPTWLGIAASLLVSLWFMCRWAYPGEETLESEVITVPQSGLALPVRVSLLAERVVRPGTYLQLEEVGAHTQSTSEEQPTRQAREEHPTTQVVGQVIQGPDTHGLPTEMGSRLLVIIPATTSACEEGCTNQDGNKPNSNEEPPFRRFRVARIFEPTRWVENSAGTWISGANGDSGFQFLLDQFQLLITEAGKPILGYNYGPVTASWVPENDRRRTRACYIHPLFGLEGELLTDDFPADHYHHHGIFWAWPHILINNQEYDLWVDRGIRQRFRRWLHMGSGMVAATFGVENGWYVGDQLVMLERIWATVWKTEEFGRLLDFEIFLQPVENPVTLWGAEGKSYGGFTFRFNVKQGQTVKITVPEGLTSEDLLETRLRWADLASQFAPSGSESGATVLIPSDHPDYPPTWLTRHYGVLCVGWPGTEPRTLSPGQSTRLPYQVWIHRNYLSAEAIEMVVQALHHARKARWENSSATGQP
jgi:hypothetical protein